MALRAFLTGAIIFLVALMALGIFGATQDIKEQTKQEVIK